MKEDDFAQPASGQVTLTQTCLLLIFWCFSSFFLLSRGFSGKGECAEMGNRRDAWSRRILRWCVGELDERGKKKRDYRQIQNSLARSGEAGPTLPK